MSHTPGPWEVKRLIDKNGKPYSTLYECHIDLGPCMIWAPVGDAEQEANARLIAAAPDLLEACEKAMAEFEHWQIYGHCRTRLQEAIKKARGEQ